MHVSAKDKYSTYSHFVMDQRIAVWVFMDAQSAIAILTAAVMCLGLAVCIGHCCGKRGRADSNHRTRG